MGPIGKGVVAAAAAARTALETAGASAARGGVRVGVGGGRCGCERSLRRDAATSSHPRWARMRAAEAAGYRPGRRQYCGRRAFGGGCEWAGLAAPDRFAGDSATAGSAQTSQATITNPARAGDGWQL